ncbi:alpha-hydroxy acid oxidase [Brevundimonas sp.]|uniref:alpha-hydroxy acid oxidase n=1 Tax=Brevundimonas sp. TaxID=1871086 RepID=UPI002FDA0A30
MDEVSIEELKATAERNVPKAFFDYLHSGSWSESTKRSNHDDLQEITFRQRVATDMSNRSLATTMVGEAVSMPVALGPVGFTGMQHARGEILAAQAAEAAGVPFTLSTMSICSIEDVAEATSRPFWFQLYFMKDRDFVADLLKRAHDAGCSALVVTLDLQMVGVRYSAFHDGMAGDAIGPKIKSALEMALHPKWGIEMLMGGKYTFGNIIGHTKSISGLGDVAGWVDEQFDQRLSFKDLDWIRKRWDRKIILKGIIDKDDAILARDFGADAIIVSNHGGRQLDGAPSTISALAPIVDAIGGGRTEIFMDSGIRSGQDVFRAIASGAKGTLIGRAYNYGLGAHGKAGVTRALDIIRDQLDRTMAFCGETDINDVGPHNLFSSPFMELPKG